MRTAKLFLMMAALAILFVGGAPTAFAADPAFHAAKITVGPTAFSTGLINLAPGTAATAGIYFGSDVTLYRSAANTLKTDDSLTVTGTLTTGALSFTDATISGTLTANGDCNIGNAAGDTITVSGTPTFAEATVFSKTVGVTGITTLTGALVANGDCTLGNAVGDTITISGTPTFAEAVTASKTLAVTGNTTLTGDLACNGAVTLGNAVGDAITVTGTPAFAEAVTMAKTLGVTGTTTLGVLGAGASTLASATITGAATVGTTLGVTGVTTCTGDLVTNDDVYLGDAAADVITVAGTPAFAEAVTMAKTLDVTGATTVGSLACTAGATVGTTLAVTGNQTNTADLTVNGNTALGNASTDTITCTGRLIVRTVTDAGPMTATTGTIGEIVYNTSDTAFYGCTVTGAPATWVKLG